MFCGILPFLMWRESGYCVRTHFHSCTDQPSHKWRAASKLAATYMRTQHKPDTVCALPATWSLQGCV